MKYFSINLCFAEVAGQGELKPMEMSQNELKQGDLWPASVCPAPSVTRFQMPPRPGAAAAVGTQRGHCCWHRASSQRCSSVFSSSSLHFFPARRELDVGTRTDRVRLRLELTEMGSNQQGKAEPDLGPSLCKKPGWEEAE